MSTKIWNVSITLQVLVKLFYSNIVLGGVLEFAANLHQSFFNRKCGMR